MFTFDESVGNVCPGMKMGFLVMRGVAPDSANVQGPREEAEIIAALQQKFGGMDKQALKAAYPMHIYAAYCKKFGYTYPVLSQLESVLGGKRTLQARFGLLRAMFLSELNSMLLTAGHDLAQLQLPLCLKVATGVEGYQSISGKEVTAVRGDVMLCDGKGVLSSILRGPDYQSRITSATTDVLFSVYAPPGIDAEYVREDLRQLERWIVELSPSSSTEMIGVFAQD